MLGRHAICRKPAKAGPAAGMLAAGLLGFICGVHKGRGGLDSARGRSSAVVAPTKCAVSDRPAANVHHFFSMATTDNASTIKKMITGKVAHHSYEQMYGHFAMPLRLRGTRLKMLEIGLGCDSNSGPGQSARLWSRLFPDAERWEAELDAACVRRISTQLKALGARAVVGDQGDVPTVRSWLRETGGAFDVIIDDGGHSNNHINVSLQLLWPALKPGGLYFIEDMHVGRQRADRPPGYPVMPDVVHAWNEQLITTFHVRPKDEFQMKHRKPRGGIPANAAVQKLVDAHPIPSDVGFIYTQRAAVVIGKLSPAGQTAQAIHNRLADGDRKWATKERLLLAQILDAYKREADAELAA